MCVCFIGWISIFHNLIIQLQINYSFTPGTQKIYLKTWGCSHNNSDSEYMAGQLASYGYKIVGKELLILYLFLD